MLPPMVGFPPHRMSDYVPCKGSGPMNLKSYYPTYRDCSVPDLSQMPNEQWIVKPWRTDARGPGKTRTRFDR